MPNSVSKLFIKRGFRPIGLADEPRVSACFQNEDLGFSDYLFSMAYLWPAPGTILINDDPERLLIACAHRGKADLLYPPLSPDKKAARDAAWQDRSFSAAAGLLREVRAEAKDAGVTIYPPRILSVPESKLAALEKVPGALMMPDLPEYVYERESIVSLSGAKYKNKRENINRFVKTYKNHKIEKIGPEHSRALIKYLLDWYRAKRPSGGFRMSELFAPENVTSEKNFFLESYLTRKYLKNFGMLRGNGLLIKVYDAIAGFIIGEKASSDTTIVLIEKVNNDLFGLSQYLFREYIKEMVGTRYVNSSDDAGSSGLKRLKESYHPIEMRKKFFAILN